MCWLVSDLKVAEGAGLKWTDQYLAVPIWD